jgi:hypothetical protein
MAKHTRSTKEQTRGQQERDPKTRVGHFTAAGDPAIKQQMRSKRANGRTSRKGNQ